MAEKPPIVAWHSSLAGFASGKSAFFAPMATLTKKLQSAYREI
jgi:hypothetical protein